MSNHYMAQLGGVRTQMEAAKWETIRKGMSKRSMKRWTKANWRTRRKSVSFELTIVMIDSMVDSVDLWSGNVCAADDQAIHER
jgi:hypothetical protein